MSLWKRISCNVESAQHMVHYYDEKGLLDLRQCLAPWIEDRIMSEQTLSSSTEQYESVALKFHEELQKKLISICSDNLLKYKAVELSTQVAQIPAMELYTNMRSGLQKEFQLVTEGTPISQNPYNATSVGMLGSGGIGMNVASNSIMANESGLQAVGSTAVNSNMCNSDLFRARHHIQLMNAEFDQFYQEVQVFLQEFQAFQNYFANSQNQRNSSIEEQAKLLFQRKPLIVTSLRRYYSNYENLQDIVINELKNWRRQQALAGNGAPFHDNLDEIQRCFELLELFVSKLLQSVRDLIMFRVGGDDMELTQLMEQVQRAQKSLVLSAFIVEKQPPQVMKTNTRFAAAVRWLIGSQLGIHLNPPTVECIILSEAQALRFVSQRTIGESSGSNPAAQSSGEIQNNVSTMEYQQNTHVFSASFRNMQLKKIKRAEKKGTESVMDEKFALLFYAVTTVNDYQIRVWTLSLPVVVIVHGNQEPQSWATITWDNAFADITREPFVVTDRVTWCQLSSALNTKFGSSTGRILTNENIEFLYEKLVRTDNIVGDRNECISWAQFCKEPLPDRSFTFWDWFFAIMKLTKDHLLNQWKAGRVTGFINKRKAQEDLLRSSTGVGTFLLRFSDSELGGITVAFVSENGVLMLQPWTARDLNIRNLADRIHDLDILRYLHPTDSSMQPMARDDAFGEFYTERTGSELQRGDGYVPSIIKVRVPASEPAQTPHHIMQSPHPQQDSMSMGNTYSNGSHTYFSPSGNSCNPTSVGTSHLDDSDSDDGNLNCVNAIQDYLMTHPCDPIVDEIKNLICDNVNTKYDNH